MTLQAVAEALNMAHGNITYHFGSAAKLQAALADALIASLLEEVRAGTLKLRAGLITDDDLVDLVFDAFEDGGAGRLIGWLAAQDSPRLTPLYERFDALTKTILSETQEQPAFTKDDLPAMVADVVIPALGASLIGPGMARALGLPATHTRSGVAREFKARRQKSPK